MRARPLLITLAVANGLIWAVALVLFREHPVLLGTAFLAYSFGLRHAVDADHIAAIDNVTAKLMQQGQRPAAVGLFFSLGHSTIVFALSAAVAASAVSVEVHWGALERFGMIAGTLMSAAFLLAIAVINLFVLAGIYRAFIRVRGGGPYEGADVAHLLAQRGLVARLCRRLFGLITQSWQMYPVGLLFGLGFDTATEVGLLGISAAEATRGLPIWSIMLFPALFAAGMALIDTADSILMLGTYGWALTRPMRKLYYNLTVTSVSVLVALMVGGLELLGLAQTELNLSGRFWDLVSALNNHFGLVGYLIVGLFATCWAVSLWIYRLRGYDAIEVAAK
jgi:high-affinity nickel-transport protein